MAVVISGRRAGWKSFSNENTQVHLDRSFNQLASWIVIERRRFRQVRLRQFLFLMFTIQSILIGGSIIVFIRPIATVSSERNWPQLYIAIRRLDPTHDMFMH